jgi:hypothetical protein
LYCLVAVVLLSLVLFVEALQHGLEGMGVDLDQYARLTGGGDEWGDPRGFAYVSAVVGHPARHALS